MNVDEYVSQLARTPEHSISWYEITDTTIRLLVSKRTPEQAKIPSMVFGRDVVIKNTLPIK